ncbi:hypothetical protein Vretimale_19090 [Volvox reticuliferus]|uniref:Uncharacterized protein n=1 Tax=Volvox reticuliferus TaxID=1737510 RepID=A0A8J4LZM5_9CHLO|nr:hypothetical protein Vretifemale_20533 [Volvox reticuliferus]GIM16457.1 hypothetical protein Vretimale_19090 [Volvox reticuliferus]
MDEENKQAEERGDADLVVFPTRSHALVISERGQHGKEGQGKGEHADGASPGHSTAGHSTSITAAEMATPAPVTPTSPPVSVALPCTPLHDTDRVRPQRSAVAVPEVAAGSQCAPHCPTIAVAFADVAVAAAAAAAGTDLPPSPPPPSQSQQQQQQQQQQEEDMRDATAAQIDELSRQLGAEVSLRRAAEAENVTLQEQLATAKAEVRAALARVNELKQKAVEAARGAADATAAVAATSASVKGLRNQLVNADEETRAEEEENQAVLQQLTAANDESDLEEADLEESEQQQQLAVAAAGTRAAEEAKASVDAVISELQKRLKGAKWSTSGHLDREPCGRGERAVKPPSPREGWRPQGGPENSAESAAAAAQLRAGPLRAVLGPEEVLELKFQLVAAEAALRGLQNELEETKQELEAANVLKEHFYEQLVEAKQRLREKKADVYKLVDVNAGLQRELAALAAASAAAARAEQKRCGSSSSSSSSTIGSGRSSSRCQSGGGSGGCDATTTSAAAAAAAAAPTPPTSLPSLHSMIEAERELLSIRALKAAYQAVLNLQRPHHSEDSSSASRGGEIEDGVDQPFDDTLGRSTAPTMSRPRPGGSGASTGISPSGAYFGGMGNSITRLRNIGNGDHHGITARGREQAGAVTSAAAPYASFSVHAYGYGTSRSATITAHFE